MSDQQATVYGMPYVPGLAQGVLWQGVSHVAADSILLLSQTDINSLQDLPAGFIVVEGAPLSHAMVKFLSIGLPTIIIDSQQAASLQEGGVIAIDGVTGSISQYAEDNFRLSVPPKNHRQTKARTTDGVVVQLRASVRNVVAVKKAVSVGADAIGLVRSEFLLPQDGSIPDVDFYLQAFNDICEAANKLPVTIRLLDITADKLPDCLAQVDAVGGALGMQGVRLFKLEPIRSMLHAQLNAISELSRSYDIRILIPYLVRREELHYWVDYIHKYLDGSIKIGAMVETPASALDFNHWFDIVDFVAIGNNDLMQCLFAADRNRPELNNYLDPYAPLLFRFLKQVAKSAKGHIEQVQLCGVLSQLPGILPVLLGLGYRVFSVDAAMIPHLKQTISTANLSAAEALAMRVCSCIETRQVKNILNIHCKFDGV